jgi:hypothetical protein
MYMHNMHTRPCSDGVMQLTTPFTPFGVTYAPIRKTGKLNSQELAGHCFV